MKISKGILLSIDSTDIKKGVLKLPETVKQICDKVIECNDDLVKVIAPSLTQIGNYNFRVCNALTTFDAPVLTQIGNYNFRVCNALTTLKFGKHKLKVKCVDKIPFIIEREKTTKGIRIYTGFNFKGTDENSSLRNETIYVAEKGNFFAHGSTVKLAISDVQFKIVAEKLKNNPINEDTEITVMYYRTVTGACDLGCREFMESNKIPFKVENEKTVELTPIKARDLLPILEKNGAYGLSKFRNLVKF
ncbi:leucine-rich repeat protein [Tenacibaculum maritimum]|uniref:leucine-rich repeat protein n=1 Tax=Tenacibaculum maritimum TaxID=107401 RepID=UPI0038776663